MAERELPLEDLLGFMDGDERARWDSGTEEERSKLREELTALWFTIPDPTDDDLKPPYTHPTNWAARDKNPDVRRAATREWKKARKAKAREDQASQPPISDESEKPAKKGIDLFKLAKRLEAAEKENPPTAEELAQRKKKLEDMARMFGLSTIYPDFSSLIESFKRDEEAIRKKFADAAKPPEWPKFDADVYHPPPIDWSKVENERRKADAEENARAMERAIDSALRKAEDRARTQRELEEFTRRAGFTPVDGEPVQAASHWRRVVAGIAIAFVALIFCFGAAYQQAGVVDVLLAHLLIGFGWIGFILSIGFADYYLPLPRSKKIKLWIIVGLVSLLFAGVADWYMVRLKTKQSAESQKTAG